MKLMKISGYWLIDGALTVAAAIGAYFYGEELAPNPFVRMGVVVFAGIALLPLRSAFSTLWRNAAQYAASRRAGLVTRDPSARVGADAGPVVEIVVKRLASFTSHLKHENGWWWRYRQRWMLLTGDVAAIEKLAPGLTGAGWIITPEAVLFYAREESELGAAWLTQIGHCRGHRRVDAVVEVGRVDTATLGYRLSRTARAIGWSAPAYILETVDADGAAPQASEPITCTWSSNKIRGFSIDKSLLQMSRDLADAGTQRLAEQGGSRYLARISAYISANASGLSTLVTSINNAQNNRAAIHGLVFAPLFSEAGVGEATIPNKSASSWQAIATHSRTIPGRRVGVSLSQLAAWAVTAIAAVWLTGTLISATTNHASIKSAARLTAALNTPTPSLQTLSALQSDLTQLETSESQGAPWLTRFGLNHNPQLLQALWPVYARSSAILLIAPIQARLESDLRQLGSMTDQELASGGEPQVKTAYNTLKTYLMLADPAKAAAPFLAAQLFATSQPARAGSPQITQTTQTAWLDLTRRLTRFHADHVGPKKLAIVPDTNLIASARQTLVSVVGLQNSTDSAYQQIIDEARSKYPPVSLQALLGDTTAHGLFSTTQMLPGVYTKAAWDERVSKAIDTADEQRAVAGDWVLQESKPGGPLANQPADPFKAALKQRYFTEYARAWQQFLNSVRWQPDTSLSGTIDQLNLLSDAQRSPLSALFKVIVTQASTGAATQSLSDSLIGKAQQIVGAHKDATETPQDLPLAAAFGPLLRNAGTSDSATTDLSLPRYLERVSAVRLKLQQIMMSPDPDALSRSAAQAILQGKTSDLGDSRDYASRVAASVGEQWSGFGDAIFQRPLDQTWDVVLQPAAASLNETWRTAILASWNKSFGGRYPFADSDNDASLPEMARFLRADNGVLAQFVSAELGGILERKGDQWVVTQANGRNALRVDPEFVTALNKLMRVSTVLFPSGDANLRYELRAIPTPGVTDVKLSVSGRELHYFNQREEWTPFVWPGDALENRTRLDWQSEDAGPRVAFDFGGRFGLIRLLERASVTPQDGARYWLKWPLVKTTNEVVALPPPAQAPVPQPAPQPPKQRERDDWSVAASKSTESIWTAQPQVNRPAPQPLSSPKPQFVQMQLRSEVGAGPLEVLKLRHFTLPARIFLRDEKPGVKSANPPPLPLSAINAGRASETPLPKTIAESDYE